jgi:putative pyruvate formate lyase activating enzyme
MNVSPRFDHAAPVELNGDGWFVLLRKDFIPAYLRAFEEGLLQQRAEEAIESLRSCRVCPARLPD